MASFKRSTQLLVWTVVLAMVAPSLVLAQDNRPQPHMQAMAAAYGMLRDQISDATKNEASLKLLAEFETAVIASKNAVPPTVAALPAAEQPARLAEYKKTIVKLLRQTLDVEDALLAGDNAKAATAFALLGATQMEGHRGFRGRGGRGGGAPRGGAGGAPGGGGPAGAGRAPQ